ncbi:MAG: PelD GGDEF domain-containing protein [Acidovorax sp.]|uniref:PelD GGDEF domain-containing protein n=1 Tax=Acidovorax sp. TaxID=1872122 RepID=UPI00260D9E78|nr:PelD GGDEF domain-containing protein [Acidovorax sp.]MDH4464168.1 PelD GGDEF domain-containing protein [Acidovorax sp.]
MARTPSESSATRPAYPGTAEEPGANGFTGSPLGKLTAVGDRPVTVLLETTLVPVVTVGLGYLLSPQDPLGVGADYHWSWLAPIIVALRYGPLAGLGAAGVLLAAWFALNLGHLDQFPQVFFLGGLITVMLVGEFSSLWRARTRRAEVVQHYLDQRLEHLIRQYYLLRLSHDRLEQELIGRPMSMRDALKTLHGLGAAPQDAQVLLRLLAQYCQISCAALHPVRDDEVDPQPMATLGAPAGFQRADPLAVQALETRTLCHVVQATVRQERSQYLVAAPLLDIGGETYAVLLVEDMPFFSLQEEGLQTMNLLLGYYTDGLSTHALAAPLVADFAQCPPEFAFELERLTRMEKSTGVPSIIVALEFNQAAIDRDLPQQMQRLKRLMDEIWLIDGTQRSVLAVLMPLGDASTAEGFIARLEGWMSAKEGMSLAQAGVYPYQFPLAQFDEPRVLLSRLHQLAHA